MDLNIFFLREKESAQQESFMVQHIPATHHYADLLTKLLSPKLATNSVDSTLIVGLSIHPLL